MPEQKDLEEPETVRKLLKCRSCGEEFTFKELYEGTPSDSLVCFNCKNKGWREVSELIRRADVIELLEEEIEEVKERLEDKKYDKTYLAGRHDGFQDLKQKLEGEE